MDYLFMLGFCLILCITLIIVFFAKKGIVSGETTIYKALIITNLIGIILEMLSIFFTNRYLNTIVATIIIKFYFVYIITFLTILLFYEYEIYQNDDSKYSLYKKCKKISFFTYLFSIVFLLFLPFEQHKGYATGTCIDFIYLYSSIVFIIFIVVFFKNRKNGKIFKVFPLLLLGLMMLILTFIQKYNPELTISTVVHFFTVFIMYHTIENPDLAMIEQLNIARDQADRANQSKSEFLSSMSHEIRTPLNAIVGFSQALQEENLPVQAQEEVKDIVRASESLLELVNGILDISKIEANKIEIVDGEYNIYEVLNDLVALSKARMGDKKLDFKPIFDKSIPPILYGDAVRVKQIILNLLTNAIKYTKEGEVIFRVSSIQNSSVCRLIVSVEDTGIGIKKENIDQLFDKFQRLDLEKNKTIEGTGLGLAITKRLVDLMNGRIMVQSVYGKGSKFTVALDQKIIHKDPEQIKIENENNSSEIRDLTGKKVLIVDDNKLNLKVASRLIEKYNCEIKTIESGFECIDLIKSGEQFDIILMDDMMPNMSGVETFHKLKELENFNTPVIALTANAISGMREKYLEEGFNDYLSKPIDKMELNKILNTYIKN